MGTFPRGKAPARRRAEAEGRRGRRATLPMPAALPRHRRRATLRPLCPGCSAPLPPGGPAEPPARPRRLAPPGPRRTRAERVGPRGAAEPGRAGPLSAAGASGTGRSCRRDDPQVGAQRWRRQQQHEDGALRPLPGAPPAEPAQARGERPAAPSDPAPPPAPLARPHPHPHPRRAPQAALACPALLRALSPALCARLRPGTGPAPSRPSRTCGPSRVPKAGSQRQSPRAAHPGVCPERGVAGPQHPGSRDARWGSGVSPGNGQLAQPAEGAGCRGGRLQHPATEEIVLVLLQSCIWSELELPVT